MGSARFHWLHDLVGYRADAFIRCRCGHAVTLDYHQLVRLFRNRRTMRWHDAEQRLVCTRCGAKGQRIVPVPAKAAPGGRARGG